MIDAEFRRDMQQNILVIRDQEQCFSLFQEKMLEYNRLEGFLPLRIQRLNGERMLFYDLHGIQPLSEVCQRILPNAIQLTTLVRSILQAIQQAAEYLLKEDDLLISLEYMFVSLPNYEAKICYYPGYHISIKKQLTQFFEEFMSCVDYEDRNAVYLMYSLYMKSKDESCTVWDLDQIIRRNELPADQSQSSPRLSMDSEVKAEPRIETRTVQQSENRPGIRSERQSERQSERHSEGELGRQSERLSEKHLEQQSDPQPERHSEIRQALHSQTNNAMKSGVKPRTQSFLASQEVPLAMSTSVMPPEPGFSQTVIKNKSIREEEQPKKSSVFRPLISNHREEEKEVWFYPTKSYLLGANIAVFVVILLGIILRTDILLDPVLKRIEPIKLIAVLCILILPSIYGLKRVFDPKNKISKMVSVGRYDLKEIAATKEINEYEISKPILKTTGKLVANPAINLLKTPELNQNPTTVLSPITTSIPQTNEDGFVVAKRIEEAEVNKNVSENKTVLLNGVQASPFAQLISEHPEKADTITLVECPFYIGTVKNQMNYSLSCPVISRYHAKIEKIDGIYYISDLNSTNGTFVNGKRLKAEEPNVLIAGDKVSFANICFIFSCPNQHTKI